ncbi:BRCA2, helical [Musa troglodytarum]|uniref:BRCA2, helical n=1 Tax=Musa troglodytarum TaxID=320322 RepID=A0A9E7G9W6_9LILI|nr:BRCA2, helical [Musa troglodytarum]
MNVSGSRESIIEFPTVELEDEGGRNEEPSVVADACNVELYQYMPEESPNLLQCGRNNHDGYEKSVFAILLQLKRHCLLLMEAIQRQENARSFALENIYSSNKTPVNQKPEKDDRHSAGSAVEIVRRIENGDGMSLGGPLIDISNITVDCMNMNRLSNEKRRPGKISYVSPFKSPRSSRFITPLKGSTSLLATGKMNGLCSSKPSTIESNCCGRISTRYPFQLKRKNLKDFFGGPPTFQDLSGSLPHEVSNMDADNAVTYRFYDASHHDEIGLETFQVMLLKSGASSSNATKEYSLDALLDVWLSKQLAAGKLFVGQKLRICGSGLCGWVGPVLSLEIPFFQGSIYYIKVSRGKVPRTLVGITRIYLILYKERFSDSEYVVRLERLEKKALQIYNQSDEGAKLCEILETAAEPEVLMADMTSKQLFSFSIYQAKQKEIRQSHLQKEIEKALKDAGLALREVTPFMRVRVAGLTSKQSCRNGRSRESLIIIWSPTED